MSLCIFLFRLRIVRTLPLFVVFLMLLTATGVHAQSAIGLVQHADKDGGTTTTTSLAFASPNTAGNWIAVCARGGFSSSQVFTVSDSNGNLYRRAAQIGFTGSSVTLAIFYAENIKGGANTVTVSDTVSAPLRIAILEYSGVATSNSLDAAVAGTGTSAFPGTPALTTTANGDLLLASIATTNSASFTVGSGYAISDFVPAEPSTKLIAEERIQPTVGSASTGASLSASDSWGAVLAAIKAAQQGTGSAPPSITSLSPTSGPAGTSVTITGSNFGSTQGTSTVNFNGATATPASWSDSTIVAPVPGGATTGNVVVTVGGVASNGIPFTVTITAVSPTITAQPTNQTVTAGQTATFSVTASGTAPLSYQWQKNGANISGATSSSYTTPATTTSDSGSTFDVIVSNSAGSVTSNTATLTVNASTVAPTITTQPANQTVTAGQTATFTVTATGTAPLGYQWQKNSVNIPGATSATYTTPATTTSDSGSTFKVFVSNSAGTATSNAATLTVNPASVAPTITAQPTSQTVTAGQSATFTVSATGTAPLSYQWQKNGANISAATSSTYTTPATTTSDSGSTFDVIVSNSSGSVTSSTATLTVNASAVAPSIAAQPTNQAVTAGQTATFTVSASGTAPLSYQWQKNGTNISAATSSSYTTPATTTSDSGSTFDVIVSNSVGSVTSNAATLTVNASAVAPTISSEPANETVTAGQIATFTVSATGTPPLSYQWQKNGADISGATSSSYTTPATTTSDSGATFDVVVSNSAGTASSNPATLTVNATTANSSGWTYVQDSLDTFCNVGASSCTIQTGTFLPTVSGSIWAVLLTTNNNVTITSVTGGGGAWTLCPNCHVFNSTLSRNEDIAYNLTGNPGTTSITVNLSGAASGQFGLNFVELIPPPASTASFDVAGTSATTSCTTCTGVGLNISATDVIIQSVAATSPSTWNAWSAPYTTLPLGEGLNLNATSGAAPTVLTTGPGAVFSAIAFKSTAGSFAPPAQPIAVVNYTARQGISCSPSCSLSIPSTGAGHLLYIEAADMTSSRISSISGGGSWVIPTGSSTCQITLSGSDALSCGYVLSSNAGVSSLSVTMSGNTNASFAIWELASTSGTFSFDVEGSATNNASFDPSGAPLALSGHNDVIFQSAFVPGGTSSVSFYPIPRVPPGGQGTMFLNNNAASVVLLNTTSGAAPLWVNQQNSATVVSAVAFSTP